LYLRQQRLLFGLLRQYVITGNISLLTPRALGELRAVRTLGRPGLTGARVQTGTGIAIIGLPADHAQRDLHTDERAARGFPAYTIVKHPNQGV
jgi:hypothetical protein